MTNRYSQSKELTFLVKVNVTSKSVSKSAVNCHCGSGFFLSAKFCQRHSQDQPPFAECCALQRIGKLLVWLTQMGRSSVVVYITIGPQILINEVN
jgi:hypothetical protein